MNRLSLDLRVQVLAAICEGASIRATTRMTGVAKNTVISLLSRVGDACDLYQDETVRNLKTERIEADELWTYIGCKERQLKPEQRGRFGRGDAWIWVAIDADSKLVPSWLLGKRTEECAYAFMHDLASRLTKRVQLSTDGFTAYINPVAAEFGKNVDYGQIVKTFGVDPSEPDTRYSPAVCTGIFKKALKGNPEEGLISTSYVERQNLTMRMSMRRLTRLSNGFSKKAENLERALALHYMYYNFVRKHATIKTTPAIAAGVTDRIWTLHDLARLPDLMRGEAA